MTHFQEAQESTDLAKGLPMVAEWDPEALAEEKQWLRDLEGRGTLARWRGYLSRVGPGWMQSAVTLGGGSAAASLFAGGFLGYKLLWLQPVAMLLGIIILSATSYQTLTTGVRPFHAMRRYVHPSVAWIWALASLAATIIWHFPQYALAGGMSQDLVKAVAGKEVRTWVFGMVFLALATAITWTYGRSSRGVRLYERMLKYMVWMIVLAFLLVVCLTGVKWGELWRGFFCFHIPTDVRGVSVMMAGFGAAVGINMTFLFPYTLLAKGWGREHRRLSRFDLLTGMFIPYSIATSLMIIAAANTLPGSEGFQNILADPNKTFVPATLAAKVLAPMPMGRIVFDLGILGMALSTITLHMLMSAFIVCEIMGWEPTGWRYRIAALIPAPGILGTVLWGKMALWIAVPTSAICGVLLPIAYVAFFILHNRKNFLGDQKPKGMAAALWNVGMLLAIVAASASGLYYLYVKIPAYLKMLGM
ncbi:MAG: divalent metal cation transporter [Planctomycetes bacterium]|nr:divalent metal cation transporter [Planctomycetota bacterium]